MFSLKQLDLFRTILGVKRVSENVTQSSFYVGNPLDLTSEGDQCLVVFYQMMDGLASVELKRKTSRQATSAQGRIIALNSNFS